MKELIDDMLELARVTRTTLHRQSVDLSAMAEITGGTGEVGKGACFHFTVSDNGDSRQTRTAA
jgi:hypothetical protein